MSKKLIVASGNAHKVEEFGSLLNGLGFDVHSAKVCGGMPDVVEDGDTFTENAQIKAEALRSLAPSGTWILSDDSGLEVDALDGAPGIYSARYAGPDANDASNRDKLLEALSSVALEKRSARFRCVLCLINPEGEIKFFEGACEGMISLQSSGEAGFGYDPVFVPEGYDQTFSELGDSIKSQLSHRAKAVDAMRRSLA